MVDFKKICCAIDFSEPSRAAMEEAARLTRLFQAELTLLHIYEARAASPEILLSDYEHAVPDLERHMGEWQLAAERVAGRPVRTVILTGSPAAEIIRFVQEGLYDLVVTATRGRTGLKHIVLGSVAERVVREAECPVLVFRRRNPEK